MTLLLAIIGLALPRWWRVTETATVATDPEAAWQALRELSQPESGSSVNRADQRTDVEILAQERPIRLHLRRTSGRVVHDWIAELEPDTAGGTRITLVHAQAIDNPFLRVIAKTRSRPKHEISGDLDSLRRRLRAQRRSNTA